MNALYGLDESKLDVFGCHIDEHGKATHLVAAEHVAKLEETGVLRVLDRQAIADRVFNLYLDSAYGIHECVLMALGEVLDG